MTPNDREYRKQTTDAIAPYRCNFCGAESWIDPSDQVMPVDYCHDDDHGCAVGLAQ